MSINKLIGNTPMIKIITKYNNKIVNVYAKLEYYNLTGSIKDRIIYYIINKSYKNKTLTKDMPLVEVTSGNTGISVAAIGAYYGHEVHIFIPKNVSIERIKIMKLYGAKVHIISNTNYQKIIKKANKFAKKINGFRIDQFNNIKNIEAHYKTTGQEIIKQINHIDMFVSGIGSGGTLMGISKKIKEKNKSIKVIAVEPLQLPILTKKKTKGKHKIEGIADNFIPSIVNLNIIDNITTISDLDAINMSRILSKKYGIGVGISSGANLLAAVINGKNNDNVVTIFSDDSKKYLSTDLSKKINKDKKLISNQIKILSIESI